MGGFLPGSIQIANVGGAVRCGAVLGGAVLGGAVRRDAVGRCVGCKRTTSDLSLDCNYF